MGERTPGLQFSLFGIPVRVELWFFIIPLLALRSLDLKGALIWTALVFVSVMLHELGHALAMKAVGFTPSITLHGLGGFTAWGPGANPTPKQSFFITLAGPSAGLALGGAVYLASRFIDAPSPDLHFALNNLVWINIVWSIINLLPILPWDGGLILDSALQWGTGRRHDRVVAVSSMMGGAAVVAIALAQKNMFLGYFGAMGLYQGYLRWNGTIAAAPATPLRMDDEEKKLALELLTLVDPKLRARVGEQLAWVRLRKGDFAGARRAVSAMGPHAPSISLQARLAATENDVDRVIELLSPAGAATEPDRPLLVSALISKERFDDVVALARTHVDLATSAATRLFEAGAYAQSLALCSSERERTSLGVHAYNEACCLCHLGRLEDAVAALQKARALGYDGLAQLQTDEDLVPVRNRPEVQALLS